MFEYAIHEAKKIGAFVTGRSAVSLGVGGTVAAGAMHAATGAFIALPLGAGIMGYLTQMDHEYREQELTNFYREELAAKFGKDPKKIGISDLKTLAKGDASQGIEANPVMAEALKHNDKDRTLSIAVHAIAAAGTLALVAGAAFAGVPALALGLGAMLTCTVADMVLQKVAHDVLDMNTPIRQDHIQSLQKELADGNHVTRGQVLDTLLSTNKGLAKQVEKSMGVSFSSLDAQEKEYAAGIIGPRFNLDQMTQDLNQGVLKPQELTFIAYGQHSGVEPKPAPVSIAEKARTAAHHMWEASVHKAQEMGHKAKMAFTHSKVYASLPESLQQKFGHVVEQEKQQSVQQDTPVPGGFVERLQKGKEQVALGMAGRGA